MIFDPIPFLGCLDIEQVGVTIFSWEWYPFGMNDPVIW